MKALPPMPASPPPRRRHDRRRALVVETDPGTRTLFRDVLEGMGFIVEAVESGVDALNAAREKPPAIILIDAQLRDVEGVEVIGWLRSNPALQAASAILISAAAADARHVDGRLVRGLLRKPVSAAAIKRTVNAALK